MSKLHAKTQTDGTSGTVTTMSDGDCTILCCPDCQSHKAGIIASSPPKAKCADCGKLYDIETFLEPNTPKPKRIAEPGKRHRRDNGPAVFEVKPCPPINPADVGTLHQHTQDIIAGGPEHLLASNKRAQILAEECGEAFGEELKLQWTLETKWLQELRATLRGRGRADYAMQWRPTFLAVVALSHSTELGAKAAVVTPNTVSAHRKADPDFDAQVVAAQAHCIELLHSVTMRSALEGDLEPVYWQGIRVDYIKKFDNRLRVELLRAHMPTTFKTPGSKVNVNTGNQQIGNNYIVDRPEMLRLQAMRQESLRRIAEKKAQAREIKPPNGGLIGGTEPPVGVPPAT
jgi:hypothetical protein